MRAESRGACAGVPEKKHAYARALEKAQAARARVSACTASSSAKKKRGAPRVARRDHRGDSRRRRKRKGASRRQVLVPIVRGVVPATASTTVLAVRRRDGQVADDGANAATTMSPTSAPSPRSTPRFRRRAAPNADAVAAFSDAFARRVATTASTREVANALSAFARVGVVPSASAATAAGPSRRDARTTTPRRRRRSRSRLRRRPDPTEPRRVPRVIHCARTRIIARGRRRRRRARVRRRVGGDIAAAFPPARATAKSLPDAPRASPRRSRSPSSRGDASEPAGRVVRTRAFVSRRGERRVGLRARFQNRGRGARATLLDASGASARSYRLRTSPRCWTRTPTRGRRPRATRSSRSEVPSRASRRTGPPPPGSSPLRSRVRDADVEHADASALVAAARARRGSDRRPERRRSRGDDRRIGQDGRVRGADGGDDGGGRRRGGRRVKMARRRGGGGALAGDAARWAPKTRETR